MPGLTEIAEVGPSLAAALVKKKYLTIVQVAAAKPIELSVVPGVSEQKAARMVASARSLSAKPRSDKNIPKRARTAVAPPKTGPAKPLKMGKPSKEKDAGESKDIKQKEKIRKLKKKIRKLKKQKKKILAKDKKRSKPSNK